MAGEEVITLLTRREMIDNLDKHRLWKHRDRDLRFQRQPLAFALLVIILVVLVIAVLFGI